MAPSLPTPQQAQIPVCMSSYFDSSELSDVVIVVSGIDGSRRINAHRIVLSAGSTYFASLFSEAWSSAAKVAPDNPSQLEVAMELAEESAHVVLLLQFLYGKGIELDLASAHPLLRMSGYYGIEALSGMCVDYLERVLVRLAVSSSIPSSPQHLACAAAAPRADTLLRSV